MADIVSMVLGAVGLVVLVAGVLYTVWGFLTVMTKKGRMKLATGIGGLIVGIILVSAYGLPTLPGISAPPPSAGGTWQICVADANGASIGLGLCPTTMNGLKSVTKTQSSPAGFYVYFNVTLTPPAGSTQTAFNVIAGLGAVQTLTNTSNPSQTGPALALRSTGVYDVKITPAGGSASYAQAIVTLSPGSSLTVAYQVHFSGLTQQLALTQYPFTVVQSFTFVDQTSGASLGSVTLSMTVN